MDARNRVISIKGGSRLTERKVGEMKEGNEKEGRERKISLARERARSRNVFCTSLRL
jgi:hypothetical protein